MKKHFAPKLLSACCSLLCAAAGSAAAGAGTSGGEFLRIVQSPRAVAMGESGAGGYGDLLGALAVNPAALGRTAYKEAAFTYNSWLEGVNSQQAAYAQPLRYGAAAVSVLALSVPGIDGYDNSGAAAGGVDAGSMAAGLSYAARLAGPWQDKLSGLFAGVTLKYARERLAGVSAGAALADTGLIWIKRRPAGTLALGVSAQSLGQGFKFDSETGPAPSVFRAGASYIMLAAGDPITFSADVRQQKDTGAAFCAGAEYQVWRAVSLRAGYVSGEDLGGGLRLGGGLVMKLLQFDYSLSSYGKFGPAHRFALSYKFDRPVAVTRHLSVEQEEAVRKTEQARGLLAEKRYYEAVLLLNEALTADPGLKDALELMRRARVKLEDPR